MASSQQPDFAGNAKTDVPPENQPGHHPPKEQDKPDLDAFAAKIGADASAPSATKARKPAKSATSKPATAKPAASKPAATKPAATKPAATKATTAKQSPAPPPKIQTTPANRPASAPASPAKQPESAPAWPESAPAPDDLGPLEGPEAAEDPEPRLVSLAMLPLRETVRRLEQLEKTLTKRVLAKAGRGPRAR